MTQKQINVIIDEVYDTIEELINNTKAKKYISFDLYNEKLVDQIIKLADVIDNVNFPNNKNQLKGLVRALNHFYYFSQYTWNFDMNKNTLIWMIKSVHENPKRIIDFQNAVNKIHINLNTRNDGALPDFYDSAAAYALEAFFLFGSWERNEEERMDIYCKLPQFIVQSRYIPCTNLLYFILWIKKSWSKWFVW